MNKDYFYQMLFLDIGWNVLGVFMEVVTLACKVFF